MRLKISLRLGRMSIPLKIEKARFIVSAMTGNANFPTPSPALATISDAIAALEAAYTAAQKSGPAKTSAMYDKVEILEKLLIQLSNYVEATANGDETIALSSGMDLKARVNSHPYSFTATNGKKEGEVKLTTAVTPRAGYAWQMSEDPLPSVTAGSTTWQIVKISVIAKTTVKNLNPGKKYWFRVATVLKDELGPWSDPVSIIAH